MSGINLCKFVFIRILIYIYVYKFFDITSMKIQRINLILYCLVTLLPFTSCSLDEKSHDMRTTVDSHGASLNSALSELNTTLGILYTETKTLAAKSTSNISEIITVTYDDIMGPETKSDENSDFGNLLYVINFEDGNGTAVLGADNRLEPVIAVIDSGYLNLEDFINPTFFEHCLPLSQLYDAETDEIYLGVNHTNGTHVATILNYVITSIQLYEDPDFSTPDMWPGTGGSGYEMYDISPLLNTAWGQGKPYNAKLNNNDAGCTTIAAAQILTCNKDIPLNTRFGVTRSSWKQLERKHFYELPDNNNNKNDSIYIWTDDMSTVIKGIADGIGVTYNFLGSGGTFATPKKVARYLKSIGYSSAKVHTKYDESEIILMLTHKKPVFIGALGSCVYTDEKKGSGHAWVIDGIKTRWDGGGRKHLLHCNWGWNGDCDGYYISKIFNTRDGAVYYDEEDSGTHNMNTKYTWWYRIITY